MFSYLRKHNSILKNEIQDVSHNISWRKSSIITYYFNFSNFSTSINYIDFFLNILCYFYNIFYNYLCKIEKKGNSLKYKKAKTAIVSKS